MLSQTRSELMKQEQVGSLNRCIKELQQQAYARGLELKNAHQGYVESRREQGSTTRRIINEGKTSPRYSNTKNSTTTFELLVLMIPFLMTPIYLQLLWWCSEFETRWDEIVLSMTRIPPDDVLESLDKLRKRESVQFKTVLELYDMEIHQKISMPNDQKFEDDGEKEYRSEATITKLWCPKWSNLQQCQWLRLAGVSVMLEEYKDNAVSGKQKDSVREESNAVSGTTVMSVQNQHQKTLHPLSHQHKEVEMRRGKGNSEGGVCLGSPIDSRAETSWKVFALKYPVTIGIFPMSIS